MDGFSNVKKVKWSEFRAQSIGLRSDPDPDPDCNSRQDPDPDPHFEMRIRKHCLELPQVIFSPSPPSGELVAKLQLSNVSGRVVGYKIKTISPEKYRVRPSTGVLGPQPHQNSETSVEIHVASVGKGEPQVGRELCS